jgi:hypothetical protein
VRHGGESDVLLKECDMANDIFRAGTTAELRELGHLDRCEAVPKLVGDPNDFLMIAGLAGTAKDTAHLCEPNANYYACAGVMGGAVAMGLGLALSQPGRQGSRRCGGVFRPGTPNPRAGTSPVCAERHSGAHRVTSRRRAA